jgi:regulator of protease activity HflC (stomatin/prohibitin superfamily)
VKTLLWTNDHKAEIKEEKQLLVVRPSAAEARGAALRADSIEAGVDPGAAVTGAAAGVALIYAEVPVLFVVEDLEKYERLAQPGSRDRLLRAIGRREVIEYFATQNMDDVLGSGRLDASDELRKRVQAKFEALEAGVRVLYVGISGVHPPIQTAGAFEQVVSSEQMRQANIESARKESTATLAEAVGSVDLARRIVGEIAALEALPTSTPEDEVKKQQQKIDDLLVAAGGKAASMIQKARADRWVRHMGDRGRAERYAGQLAAFRASPAVYAAGQYFQTLLKIMGQARVYITADSSVPVEIRMNLEDAESSTGLFNQLNKDE